MAVKKNFVVKNGLEVGDSASITGVLVASGISYPTSDGTTGQVLTTNGAGSLTFQDAGIDSASVLSMFSGGTGITFSSGAISTNDGEIVHDNLSGFVANEHIDHSTVSITAGAGLTGGGTIAASRTLDIGAGTGITVNANDIAVNMAAFTTSNLSEGSNLYYTTARADSDAKNALTGGTGVTYTAATGTIAIGQDVSTSASPSFAGLTVDTTTLTVDATNDTVGIGMTASTTASQKLNVNGRIATLSHFSAVAPSATNLYQFMSNDTDTYIGSPAADTIAITTGNSERIRVGSSGQLGIGGTNYGTSGQVLTSNGSGSAPSWQDASGGGGITYVRKTANYTASAGEGVIADTSAGGWTLTLPASPTTGDVVVVADGDDWSTNNLTIARNGSFIEGADSDMLMDVAGASVTFLYDSAEWEVYVQGASITAGGGGATGGGTDEIFWENDQNVTTNYTITNGKNAMSAGPITVDSGVTVTIGAGEVWTVV